MKSFLNITIKSPAYNVTRTFFAQKVKANRSYFHKNFITFSLYNITHFIIMIHSLNSFLSPAPKEF